MLRKQDLGNALGTGQGLSRRPASLAFIANAPLDAASAGLVAEIADVVEFFPDGDAFLASPGCYQQAFYVVGSETSLRDGVALLRLLQRRSTAGLLAWRTRAPAAAWLDAGADVWLPRAATVEDLMAGVRAVQRRRPVDVERVPAAQSCWRLGRSARHLHTPRGVVIPLAEGDFNTLAVFVAALGDTVPYAVLNVALGHQHPEADNLLHAAMYRLRRRIERATDEPFPLASQTGVGYLFRAVIVQT